MKSIPTSSASRASRRCRPSSLPSAQQGDPPKRATLGFLLGPDNELIEIYRNDDLPFSQEQA